MSGISVILSTPFDIVPQSLGSHMDAVRSSLPAPPDEVNHAIVTRELLTLQSVQLTWVEPEDNNARINSYNVTYCPSVKGTCEQLPIQMSVSTETVTLSQLTPVTTYQVYIRAENDVGQGPEPAEPYLFDSANQGMCCLSVQFSVLVSMHAIFHSGKLMPD